MEGAGRKYTFAYRTDKNETWSNVSENVDASLLSTEAAGGFVGTTLGMYVRSLQAKP
jgi:alpha-N-arabinofuranosidase